MKMGIQNVNLLLRFVIITSQFQPGDELDRIPVPASYFH